MKEFELINRFFTGRGITRRDVDIGIGDDCALVTVPEGCQLAVTTDTLVEGVHFFSDISPKALGHRVLAVNLSDLAAMGAEPAWISIGLTLPNVDETWMEQFTQGMHDIAEYYNVQLIGGDTTQGPLTITVCAKGIVPKGKALTRSGAKVGDWLFVTGDLGDAALAIEARTQGWELSGDDRRYVQKKFDYPAPQVAAGQVLRDLANSAIDISDGLLADLSHILTHSGVGATIHADKVPLSNALKNLPDEEVRLMLAMAYGDDYQLLFTVPDSNRVAVEKRLAEYGVTPACIGQINANAGDVSLLYKDKPWPFPATGFEHFS
jgi:thiamine-monophosphate kinase